MYTTAVTGFAKSMTLRSRREVRRRRCAMTLNVRHIRKVLRSPAAFTQIELLIVILISGILIVLGIRESRRARENAKLASCMSFHIAINRNVFTAYAEYGDFPTSLDGIIDNMDAWMVSSKFQYVGGNDFDKGHGNDWSGNDKDNPGASNDGTVFEPGYYLRCSHDHSRLGILFVDSGNNLPPKAIYDESDARGTIPSRNK
jgi:type II secretory pathway pseudopilin PulG